MLKKRILPVLAAATVSSIALAAEPTTAELKAQIEELTKKVEAIEAREAAAPAPATQQSSAQAVPVPVTAGFDKGKFVIRSADGKFSLNPIAQLQFRYDGAWRDDTAASDSGYEDGFEIRRAKFGIQGNIVRPELTYKLQWATERSGGDVILEDAWARYRFNDNFAIFGGQFEDLTTHESLVSSSRQLAVEQSYANKVLVDGISEYTQGVGAVYERNKYRVSAALTDGASSENTNFVNHAIGATEVYWGAAARGEYLIIGESWKPYDDFTARGNKTDLLAVGGGVSRTEAADTTILLYGVDAQWEPQAVSGLGVFAAIMGNDIQRGAAEDLKSNGFLVQAGYMLNSDWEVFARYDVTNFDSDAVADENNIQEITLGANYYMYGHQAKFTADLTYLPDGAPQGESGLGILAQPEGETEIVARVQFQVLI